MNTLLAVNGSDHSVAAAETIANRPWPPGNSVKILSVVRLAVYADCEDQITGGRLSGVQTIHRRGEPDDVIPELVVAQGAAWSFTTLPERYALSIPLLIAIQIGIGFSLSAIPLSILMASFL